MRSIRVSTAVVIALMACTAASPARAQSQAATPAQTSAAGGDVAEQEHIRSCDADAASKGINGGARESFMRTCLSRKIGEGNLNAAQRKMESCTAKATEQSLQGEARTSFMNTCLAPPPAAAKAAAPAAS